MSSHDLRQYGVPFPCVTLETQPDLAQGVDSQIFTLDGCDERLVRTQVDSPLVQHSTAGVRDPWATRSGGPRTVVVVVKSDLSPDW